MTTDSGPTLVGKQKGTDKLIEEKVGQPIMKPYSILYQVNLCAKMSNSDLNEVMAKLVNSIVN